MGFLDKARTKARVAPLTIQSPLPFEAGAPWRTQNAIPADALVRGVFAQIETRGLGSGTGRGRQGSLARIISEQSSVLWYMQGDDAASWRLRLGLRAAKTGAYYLDWTVRVDCRENAGTVEALIQTPGYLTRDGALVNGDAHDRLRDLLVAAFRGTDGGVGAAAEVALVRQSMQSPLMLDEPVDFTRFGDCAMRTALTDEKLGEVLRHVRMPLVESTPTRHVYRLGPDRPDVPRSLGTLTWDDACDEEGMRTLRLSFALQQTGSTFVDAMVTRAALNLARRLYAYAGNEDDAFQWTGPDLYSWVW